MKGTLPYFRYHPDPLATESIEPSSATCKACKQSRGFIYKGSVYCVENLDDEICPWCIANGTAHEIFGASFTDENLVGGHFWETVPMRIMHEVAFRTPGFAGWQQERWWTHCGDAAAFMGPAGRRELEALGKEAIAEIKKESGYDGKDWDHYFQLMEKDQGPTAYLFKCLHCGKISGYSDCH